MKLTNNSRGPKAITTTDRGVVVLAAGQSDDLNVSENDAAAIERHKLLEAPEGGGTPSLADVQRAIASGTLGGAPAAGDAEADTGSTLPAEDDPDVVALRDGSTSTELQQIAADEKVDMEGARNKTQAAQRIVAARRAAPAAGSGGPAPEADTDTANLPAADDADVIALVDGNDEAQLRQLATDETVAVKSDDDKADLARKIVAARRAK